MSETITLTKIQGFTTPDFFLFLENLNGDFYVKKSPGKFNLTPGTWTIKAGTIQKLKNPVSFRIPKLPKPARNFKPANISFFVGDNPHKASIFPHSGLMIFDREIMKKKPAIIAFIFYHELGHLKYKKEENADLYSVTRMLKRGYNPTQILQAASEALSKNSFLRIKEIFNKLKK